MDKFLVEPFAVFDNCLDDMVFKVFSIGRSTSRVFCTSGIFYNTWFSIDVECDYGLKIKVATLNGRNAFFEFVSGD